MAELPRKFEWDGTKPVKIQYFGKECTKSKFTINGEGPFVIGTTPDGNSTFQIESPTNPSSWIEYPNAWNTEWRSWSGAQLNRYTDITFGDSGQFIIRFGDPDTGSNIKFVVNYGHDDCGYLFLKIDPQDFWPQIAGLKSNADDSCLPNLQPGCVTTPPPTVTVPPLFEYEQCFVSFEYEPCDLSFAYDPCPCEGEIIIDLFPPFFMRTANTGTNCVDEYLLEPLLVTNSLPGNAKLISLEDCFVDDDLVIDGEIILEGCCPFTGAGVCVPPRNGRHTVPAGLVLKTGIVPGQQITIEILNHFSGFVGVLSGKLALVCEDADTCIVDYLPCEGTGEGIVVLNDRSLEGEPCLAEDMPANIIVDNVCYQVVSNSTKAITHTEYEDATGCSDVSCGVCTAEYMPCDGLGGNIIVPNNTPIGDPCNIVNMPHFITISNRCYTLVGISSEPTTHNLYDISTGCNDVICESTCTTLYSPCDGIGGDIIVPNNTPVGEDCSISDMPDYIIVDNVCFQVNNISTEPVDYNNYSLVSNCTNLVCGACTAEYVPCEGTGGSIFVPNNTLPGEPCTMDNMPDTIIVDNVCYQAANVSSGSTTHNTYSVVTNCVDQQCGDCSAVYTPCAGTGEDIIVPNNTPAGEDCTIADMPDTIIVDNVCYQLSSLSTDPTTHNAYAQISDCLDISCGSCTTEYTACIGGGSVIVSNNTPLGMACSVDDMPDVILVDGSCYQSPTISTDPTTNNHYTSVPNCLVEECGICTAEYVPCVGGSSIFVPNNTPIGELCVATSMPDFILSEGACYFLIGPSSNQITNNTYSLVAGCGDAQCP